MAEADEKGTLNMAVVLIQNYAQRSGDGNQTEKQVRGGQAGSASYAANR